MTKIWGDNLYKRPPTANSGGDSSPRPPVIYARVTSALDKMKAKSEYSQSNVCCLDQRFNQGVHARLLWRTSQIRSATVTRQL
jgi:hypothetical protein